MERPMETLLLIPVDDSVVYPNMQVTLAVDAGSEDRVVLVPRKGDEFASVGTVAQVTDRVRLPGGARAVALDGLHRGLIGAARTDASGALRVDVTAHPDTVPVDGRTRDLEREYRAVVEEILELRGVDDRVGSWLRAIAEPGALADTIGYAPDVSFEEKVRVLETLDVTERLELAVRIQRERLTELQLRRKIREDVREGVEEQATKELGRLERMGEQSGEASMIRSYLDWLIAVPWKERSDEVLDPVHARPDASSSACRSAASATRPRSAGTAAPTSAPSRVAWCARCATLGP